MLLLDLSNDILLDILFLVDPVDILNIYNVCQRLRALAERTMNHVVLKLHLTGKNCFPNFKSQPFENLDRIRVNKNWINGIFRRKEKLTNYRYIYNRCGIVLDEHLYVAEKGAIRKYNRLWINKYFKTIQFKFIGNKMDHVTTLAKKDNVIFISCLNKTCMIFDDEKSAMERAQVFKGHIRDMDLFPKNDIFVIATYDCVEILDKSLMSVDFISKGSRCVEINSSGEKLITGDMVTLYDFKTKTTEELAELEGVLDLSWRDDQTFLSGHEDGSLKLFDLRTKSVCQRIDSLARDNCSIQFDGQNTVLCGFSSSKTISICDLRVNKIVKDFKICGLDNRYTTELVQIVADPKHLFVVTTFGLQICDFSA